MGFRATPSAGSTNPCGSGYAVAGERNGLEKRWPTRSNCGAWGGRRRSRRERRREREVVRSGFSERHRDAVAFGEKGRTRDHRGEGGEAGYYIILVCFFLEIIILIAFTAFTPKKGRPLAGKGAGKERIRGLLVGGLGYESSRRRGKSCAPTSKVKFLDNLKT
jgi:hypothetical protein